ncbi:MAG: glutamate formimidoyltransferase [bacterium]|nr:glutamate formimidoyltransferase [bacterium]MDD4558137.1 glutamate formimidoyltransferase [bacterium]
MEKLVECIPNFSEGRSLEVVERLVDIVRSGGAELLDYSSDPDHNRTVITYAGDMQDVVETAFKLARQAVEEIDMRSHSGVHPRIGALDVLPLVPLENTTLDDCISAARELGKRLGKELQLPVYYYGYAARNALHVRLSDLRRGGLEGLKKRMLYNPDWRPDEGPGYLHPTAGAVALGVRKPLIAYNVNLRSDDLKAAQRIAAHIRERGGGLHGVDALGVRLAEAGMVQVTVNLRDRGLTSLDMIYDDICTAAAEEGITVDSGELIGMIPLDEVMRVFGRATGLSGVGPERVLEWKLKEKN